MDIHLLAIAVLVAAFVWTTLKPINLGAIALAATFLVGSLVAGLKGSEALAGFPGDLFVVIAGVTYLFNVANKNGAVDWLVAKAVGLVKDRMLLLPWIMFGLAGLLSSIGAVYSVPVVAPIALVLAARHRLPPALMGLMVIHGWGAGSLSPISLYGVMVGGILRTTDIAPAPGLMFAIGFAANFAAGLLVWIVMLGVVRRTRRAAPAREHVPEMSYADGGGGVSLGPVAGQESSETAKKAAPQLTLESSLTLLALVMLVVGAVIGYDVGLLAFALAVALGLLNSRHHRAAVADLPWGVILLTCGVLTYVAMLETLGTIEWLGELVTTIGTPIAAALALAYIGGLVSAFATSSGIIAALIPLGLPLLEGSSLAPIAVVSALVVASTIVDVSPFSANGAIVVANTREEDRDGVFRALLRYAALVVVVAPGVLWATVILPTAL